jgi:hypothetical protein
MCKVRQDILKISFGTDNTIPATTAASVSTTGSENLEYMAALCFHRIRKRALAKMRKKGAGCEEMLSRIDDIDSVSGTFGEYQKSVNDLTSSREYLKGAMRRVNEGVCTFIKDLESKRLNHLGRINQFGKETLSFTTDQLKEDVDLKKSWNGMGLNNDLFIEFVELYARIGNSNFRKELVNKIKQKSTVSLRSTVKVVSQKKRKSRTKLSTQKKKGNIIYSVPPRQGLNWSQNPQFSPYAFL